MYSRCSALYLLFIAMLMVINPAHGEEKQYGISEVPVNLGLSAFADYDPFAKSDSQVFYPGDQIMVCAEFKDKLEDLNAPYPDLYTVRRPVVARFKLSGAMNETLHFYANYFIIYLYMFTELCEPLTIPLDMAPGEVKVEATVYLAGFETINNRATTTFTVE